MNEQIINDKLDEILALLRTSRIQPTRRNPRSVVDVDAPTDRAAELLRIFNKTCSIPNKKKEQQGFPLGTYDYGYSEHMLYQIVPRSILINRCSLRKAFRPSGEKDYNKSAIDIVNETLDALIAAGKVFQSPLDEAPKIKIPHNKDASKAVCIFSVRWAEIAGLIEPKQKAKQSFTDYLREQGNTELLDKVTKASQKPLETANPAQETASEAELIKFMQESEQDGLLDDSVTFERSEEKIKL